MKRIVLLSIIVSLPSFVLAQGEIIGHGRGGGSVSVTGGLNQGAGALLAGFGYATEEALDVGLVAGRGVPAEASPGHSDRSTVIAPSLSFHLLKQGTSSPVTATVRLGYPQYTTKDWNTAFLSYGAEVGRSISVGTATRLQPSVGLFRFVRTEMQNGYTANDAFVGLTFSLPWIVENEDILYYIAPSFGTAGTSPSATVSIGIIFLSAD